ncbi:MAG: AbrB/MazE/SpoVT family DNA-binding domain-containing protein [Steroidobacteraceae bacterium]
MAIAQSKLTSQSQISVPAEVRKRLGVGPGSILEWHDEDGNVVVRKAGRFSSSEIHEALFAEGSMKGRKAPDVKAAIRKYVRQRHARC